MSCVTGILRQTLRATFRFIPPAFRLWKQLRPFPLASKTSDLSRKCRWLPRPLWGLSLMRKRRRLLWPEAKRSSTWKSGACRDSCRSAGLPVSHFHFVHSSCTRGKNMQARPSPYAAHATWHECFLCHTFFFLVTLAAAGPLASNSCACHPSYQPWHTGVQENL